MTRKERDLIAEVENSPLAWELRELVRAQAIVRTSSLYVRHITHHAPDGQITRRREIEAWCSGAKWLLDKLNSRAATVNKGSEKWPKKPQQLGIMLNKLTPGLLLKNVRVTYSRHELYGRLWTFWAVEYL